MWGMTTPVIAGNHCIGIAAVLKAAAGIICILRFNVVIRTGKYPAGQ